MLLQRLDDLKNCYLVDEKTASPASTLSNSTNLFRASTLFEDYLITLVKYLSQQKKWKENVIAMNVSGANKIYPGDQNTLMSATNSVNTEGPNMLYLATALNLAGFIHILFQWADSNPPTPELKKEVDCASKDLTGHTPLVR